MSKKGLRTKAKVSIAAPLRLVFGEKHLASLEHGRNLQKPNGK